MENTITLPDYHNKGGNLFTGLKLICKSQNAKPPKIGILKNWNIKPVKNDVTGYAKYAESLAKVEVDGVEENWPFSMLFLEL